MKRNNLRAVQLWVSVSELDTLRRLTADLRESFHCVDKTDRSFAADLNNYLEGKYKALKDAKAAAEQAAKELEEER